jgi:hypothetical protein
VSSGQPTWRRVFDRVERAVGQPLEDAAASSRYVDIMLTTMKVQRKVGGAVGRAIDHRIGGLLHAVNIPTRSDVRRLSKQLAALTGEVRALSATTQEIRALAGADGPRRAEPAQDGAEVRDSA